MAALVGAVVLAGCGPVGTDGTLSFLQAAERSDSPALPGTTLAGGRISVSGPQGYCIDATTLRRTPTGGFAAIASCNILTGGAEGPIVEPVLLTVSVSPFPGTAPTLAELASALGTDLLTTRDFEAVTAGQMASGGANAFQGSDARHWRGVFVLGTEMIGLALYAPVGSPLLGAQGASFLNTVSSRIRANSSPREPIAQQSQPAPDPAAARVGRLSERRDL